MFVRVVGSGLSRTGTRSVYAELIRQGVSAVHYPYDLQTQEAVAVGNFPRHLDAEVVLDLSTAAFFDVIAQDDPEVRILHTTRDRESWLPAVQRHYDALLADWSSFPQRFQDFSVFITKASYGAFPPREQDFARAFDAQESRVREWMARAPDRVLVVDVFTGRGHEELGPFLDRPTFGAGSFPHVNDTDEVPLNQSRRERTVLFAEPTGQSPDC